MIDEVDKKQPFNDKYLEEVILGKKKIPKYCRTRANWEGKDMNWKEFVKLARFHNRVPPGKKVFCGLLHDCEKACKTNECGEPIVE